MLYHHIYYTHELALMKRVWYNTMAFNESGSAQSVMGPDCSNDQPHSTD